MSWLIESYLEEEMKTSNDFYKKGHEEFNKKNDDISKATERHEKIASNTKNLKDRINIRHDEKDREPHLDDSRKEAMKSIMSSDPKESMKHSKNALDHIDKAVDVYRKRDAILRHNRRHPAAAVNASADMLVEMMQ